MRDGCLGLFCQHTNFLRHHSKSFSGFSRTCCLNGCIQCQQIRLSRDLHNRFCQNSNLVDYFNFLQCPGQSFVDLFMNGFGTLIILCNILLNSYRTFTDRICFGGTILRTCRNILRCTLNLMRHSIDLFRRCRCLFHSGCQFLCSSGHILDLFIQSLNTVINILYHIVDLCSLLFDFTDQSTHLCPHRLQRDCQPSEIITAF